MTSRNFEISFLHANEHSLDKVNINYHINRRQEFIARARNLYFTPAEIRDFVRKPIDDGRHLFVVSSNKEKNSDRGVGKKFMRKHTRLLPI